MSVDLPLPMPTGRATSMVGAPNDVSAGVSASGGSEDTASAFDTLMAALGPVAVSDEQTTDDADAAPPTAAPVTQAPDAQAGLAAAQPVATAVLPQLIADLQAVQPQTVAEAPVTAPQIIAPQIVAAPVVVAPVVMARAADKTAAAAVADDTQQADADAPAAETPAQPLPAIAPAMAVQAAPAKAAPVQTPVADDASAPVRPVAPKIRAAATDDAKTADTDSDDQAPAVSADATVLPVVVAQVPVQPQTQVPVQAPKSSPSRPAAQAAAPVTPQTPAPKVADAAATLASAPAPATDQPKTSDAKPADTTTADTTATQSAAPAATPAPVQPQQKPADALAGSLKAARKALAEDGDVRAVSAPRSQAPSAFSLQAQVEAPGAYTATGAQSAGTTQAGSNLARATVETLSNMAVQINRKLSEGNTKFAVELHPADLGKVEVTLSIARDGTTTAHLKFDTPVTAASFQAQEGELRQQLAQSGLNLDSGSLTFSSRDNNSAGFNQAFAQMQQQNQPQGQQNRQSQARAFKNAQAVAADADASAAVDASLLAQRASVSSTLALNLIV